MVNLYQIDSPINREQRNNINATFADIQTRFSNLRFQISILAGGADLDEIIQRIEDTITNANNTTANTQMVLDDITTALNTLQGRLDASDTATQEAIQATADVATAIQNLQSELLLLQNEVEQLGKATTYDNVVTYQRNNVVEYNGSSFMAIQETTGNLPPTLPIKRNDYWQLLAQRGVDGSGSVSSINSISPNVDGDVNLIPSNIGALSLDEYQQKVSAEERRNYFSVTDFGALGDGIADDTQAIIDTISAASQANQGNNMSNRATVYFPHGRYRLTSNITIDSPYLNIKGDGQRNSIIEAFVTSGPLFNITSDYGVKFEDLYILNLSTGDVKTINFSRGESHVIENCDIQNAANNTGDIIYYQGASTKIINNSINNYELNSYAIRVYSADGQININTDIVGNYIGGTGKGIIIESASDQHRPEGIKINGNTLLLTGPEQITIRSAFYVEISSNIIDVANNYNIWINPVLSGVNGVTITNNYFGNNAEYGQVINMENNAFSIKNINVSNNFFGKCGYAVRASANSDGITIKGNHFNEVLQASISLSEAKNCIITENIETTTNFSLSIMDGTNGGSFIIANNIFKGSVDLTRTDNNRFLISNNIGIT